MRNPMMTTYTVEVERLGTFTFKRRTMLDEQAVHARYSSIIGGQENPTLDFHLLAHARSILEVLMVQAPDGWALDALDPYDSEAMPELFAIVGAVRAREDEFRKDADDKRAARRANAGG